MIDIGLLRDEASRKVATAALAKRGVDSSLIEQVVAADEAWRSARAELDALSAQKNAASKQIASASPEERSRLISDMQALSEQETQLTQACIDAEATRQQLLYQLPNIPQDDVPEGGEKDFTVISESKTPKPTGELKDYLTLLGGNIDLDRAAKVSGSRFVYFTGKLARLEIGLVSFIFDQLAEHNFVPVIPPVLVKEPAMAAMGYFDQERDEVYVTQDDLFLVGTSEQSIGPMHMDEILEEGTLPRRYVGYSSCFRREAGSHGKDVKGILRMHQFEKVEMFSFTTPEQSQAEHDFLLSRQQAIMDALELPYRVIALAAGDLGTPSAKTYDIETWIPSEETYRETHSTSNTTDFQARRLRIRIKTKNGNVYAHLLNGTAVAMSRILIALIENHQRPDGTVAIPAALHPYLPFTEI